MGLPKLITFDCAGTLVWTDWNPRDFLIRCGARLGISMSHESASRYLHLFLTRQPEYWASNRPGTEAAWRAFWIQLGTDWLIGERMDPSLAPVIHQVAEEEIDSPNSETFRRFDDVIPTLERLKRLGLPMAVLSNWDQSLHRCLRGQGIHPYFQAVFASLEWGVEKPDAGFFQVALDHFGLAPGQVLHIGDDPVDDGQGAAGIGMPVLQIDRAGGLTIPAAIRSLSEIADAAELGGWAWFD